MKPQRIGFLFGELEHEIVWETCRVAFDSEIQDFRLYLIQTRQIAIAHYLLAANEIDLTLDQFDGDRLTAEMHP